MRTAGNELTIYRGEGFSMDFTVQSKDDSPYICPKIEGLHILVVVSDSKYEQNARNKVRYFLPVPEDFKFEVTNVIPLEQLTDGDGNSLYSDFPECSFDEYGDYLSAYYNGELCAFSQGDVVFSLMQDGEIVYKYADYPVGYDRGDSVQVEWKNYSFRFVHSFLPEETRNWSNGTMYYSVSLVAPASEASENKNFDLNIPLIGATTITVLSNLEGGI